MPSTSPLAAYIIPGREIAPAIELVVRAEALGYDSVWVTHGLGRDSFLVLAAYGALLFVVVLAWLRETLPPERRAQLEGRASQAHLSMSRSGWEIVVLPPSARLREVWQASRMRPLVVSGS